MMHAFFGKMSVLESNKLADLSGLLSFAGFDLEKEKYFHRSMIFSHVYGSKSQYC